MTTASAQTPPDTLPSASANLGVTYGNTTVRPNTLLPEPQVARAPSISFSAATTSAQNQTYLLALVDLSIPLYLLNATSLAQGNLTRGINNNRTTRLHWLQPSLSPSTSTSNATTPLVPHSAALASYGGPMPPPGDIAHDYVFYLFSQPANFSVAALGPPIATTSYEPASSAARMNFSVDALVRVLGEPVAGSWIRVRNVSGSATATGTGANATGTATGSASPGVFTGAAGKAAAVSGWVVGVAGLAAFVLNWL